ncbi:MAG: cell division protein FtsK [Streptosporangiales bacterium]|nr:cell division protein FtsK [Streptosporangiales bacterium]
MTDEVPGRESIPRRRAAPPPTADAASARDVWRLPDAAGDDPAAWEARIRGIRAAFEPFVQQAQQVAAAERTRAEQRRAQAYQEADTAAEHARGQVGGYVGDALTTAGAVATDRAQQLAPGLGWQPYGTDAWRAGEGVGAGLPSYVRIGTVHGGDVPIVVPVTDLRGWQVWTDHPVAAHALVQNVVLRMIATARPLQVRVDAYDPRLSGALGLFGRLHQRAPGVLPAPANAPDQLTALLTELVATSSRRGARMTQHGYDAFAQLAAHSSRTAEPYRVLVLLDYPAGVDAAAQRELIRIAKTADSRGLCLLVHHDPDVTPARDVDAAELLSLLQPLAIEDGRLELDRLEDLPVTVDPPPGTAEANAICDMVGDLVERATLPTVDFAETLPPERDWWQPVAEELSTVIGYADDVPATLQLRSSNPPLPNVLVGGAVGSGKSNLLHNLIHGLATRYAPADLEMYVLDFKQGIEFATLGPTPDQQHWLPHVRVLGVHSDRPFGLAVLQYLTAELERRSDVFKRQHVTDIADLPPGADRPPRILVVLDEFQVLFEEDSSSLAEEAIRLLEQLVRQGRAYGMHVVLATQSLAGIQRLAIKRESIFGQVPYRVVLKTTPSDSQSMLQLMNSAAAELQFRGEAILNDSYGAAESNRRILVSYAEKTALDGLRHRLWERSDDLRPPRIFQVGEPAKLAAVGPAETMGYDADDESYAVWLGMPISVAEDPVTLTVRPEPGAGLAVLGDGPLDALGVLTGVAYSLGADPVPGTRFVLFDLLPASDPVAAGKAALLDLLRRLGADVTVVGRPELDGQLVSLRDLVRTGTAVDQPVHVLGLGMHRATRLQEQSALREIVADGPAAGVCTYAWWNRLHVCTAQLGMNRSDLGAYLFLRHPSDGVKRICGAQTQWASERFRGLFWDGLQESPTVVVPFGPLGPEDVDRLAEVPR